MSNIHTVHSSRKSFWICQVSILILAILTHLGANTIFPYLVRVDAPSTWSKLRVLLIVIVFATLLILAFGIVSCWKRKEVAFWGITAQSIGLLTSIYAFYQLISSLDGVILGFVIYPYYGTFLFSLLLFAMLNAKQKKSVTPAYQVK